MIALVNASMERSGVIDAKTGKAGVDPIRTSFGGVIGRGADPLIASIEQRIADWTHIPASHGEAFQVGGGAAVYHVVCTRMLCARTSLHYWLHCRCLGPLEAAADRSILSVYTLDTMVAENMARKWDRMNVRVSIIHIQGIHAWKHPILTWLCQPVLCAAAPVTASYPS